MTKVVMFWSFKSCLLADIRELISLDDVMEELGLGPNGALIYCMEYPFSLCQLLDFYLCINCLGLLLFF